MRDYHLLTQRLHLLPFTLEDSEEFQKLNKDSRIREFVWDNEEVDGIISDEVMDQNLYCFDHHRYGLWKIQLEENPLTIGYVGLWSFFDEPQPQLIYALLGEYTRNGYATEASTAVIGYAFEKLGFTYLIATTDEPNIASQKVASRLGMCFTGKEIKNNRPTLFYRIDCK
ncbi:MAG: GNAT family N-acetyltransferase [Bacteroidota bacterium]